MDINKDFSTYKIINIEPECFKTITSYPCYHKVTVMLNNNNGIINNSVLPSDIIIEYYKYYNMNIPFHFSENKYRN